MVIFENFTKKRKLGKNENLTNVGNFGKNVYMFLVVGSWTIVKVTKNSKLGRN